MARPKEEAVPSEPDQALDTLLDAYADLDSQVKKAKKEMETLKGHIFKAAEKKADERYIGPKHRATIVRPERIEWDMDQLYDLLDDQDTFDAITQLVVVPDRLEAAVKAKNVTMREILPAAEIHPNKPYVRVT